jgi:hypothetical protein
LVTKTQLLKPGEEITFYPKQGESFALSKDFQHLEEGANYDVIMKNGNRLYFESKNQEDDMYIIFNEATDPGDVVLVKVNRGYFTSTIQSFEALPQTVKKVLKASVKRHKSRKKSIQNQTAVIETEEFCFDAMGEIIECHSTKATINQPDPVPVEEKNVFQEEKHQSFLTSLADKIKNALSKITENLKTQESSATQVRQERSVSVKDTSKEKHFEKVKKTEKAKKAEKKPQPEIPEEIARSVQTPLPLPQTPKMANPDINQYNYISDHEIKAGVKLETPSFQTLPLKKMDQQQYAQRELERTNRVAPPSMPAGANSIAPAIADKNIQVHSSVSPLLRSETLSKTAAKLSKSDNLRPSYTKPVYQKPTGLPIERHLTGVQPNRPQLKVSEPAIAGHTISAGTQKNKPVFSKTASMPVARMESLPVSAPQFASGQRGIASETTAGPEGLQEIVREPQLQQAPSPVVEVKRESLQKLPKMQEPQAVTPPPVIAQSTVPEERTKPGDKIVITKIIEKKKKAVVEEPIERMSDRLLGGGYSSQNAMGQVSVKAYSNRKPISAWVEVYKGKRRVKTFYTSGGKAVKLPAGTYIMKATYRTGTSKQKKSLGKVKLQEGETIRKKVYFNVGKLKIIANRREKPLYVKVEIYKKGSSQRYAYTFSSRATGQAHLQLAEGRYKIVVLEHRNKKVFDNVYIKGNASKTIRVEF